MSEVYPELSDQESEVLVRVLSKILDSRAERAERVKGVLELLLEADDITRQVGLIYIKHLIEIREPETILQNKVYSRDKIIRHAPGLYMAFGRAYEKLVDTGEFVGLEDLVNSSESLGFNEGNAYHAAGVLFHWTAVRNPNSDAEEMVRRYGTVTQKMSGFNTEFLLFSRSLLHGYVDDLTFAAETLAKIDPIIVLTATDDWERATALMSPSQVNRIP